MKTIVETATKLSKYMLADDVAVVLNAKNILVGDPALFVIGDLKASTVSVYENVTAPDDWTGNKYNFDGTDWTVNPDWVEPTEPAQEELSETENSA
jgi:hypothetical protein